MKNTLSVDVFRKVKGAKLRVTVRSGRREDKATWEGHAARWPGDAGKPGLGQNQESWSSKCVETLPFKCPSSSAYPRLGGGGLLRYCPMSLLPYFSPGPDCTEQTSEWTLDIRAHGLPACDLSEGRDHIFLSIWLSLYSLMP